MFFRRNKAGDGNIFLIVGLGNPGREYSDSRHNCGFKAIECLASQLSGLTPFKENIGLCLQNADWMPGSL